MEESIWRVGADASLQDIVEDPACPRLLVEVLSASCSWQERSETTIGTAIRAAQLMPQCVAAIVVLGATVTLDGDEGKQEVPVEAVVRREVKGDLVSLQIERRPGARWGEARVARTPSDDPIVAAFAALWSDGNGTSGVRLALTGVSSDPVWLADAGDGLVGYPLDEQRIRNAAAAVEAQVEPRSDYRGSAAYRRAMAGVLARRALEACLKQEVGDA